MTTNAAIRPSAYGEQTGVKKTCILIILAALLAFLGWVGETCLFLVVREGFVDRGILTLPFCPLYGFGTLLVYAVLRTPQSGVWKRLYNKPRTKGGKITVAVLCVLLYALAAALLASLVEYGTGLFYDKVLHTDLWSYHRYPDNIDGYVSIRYSLLWGVSAVAVMGLVWYPLANVLARANFAAVSTVAVVLLVLITADFVFNMTYLWTRGTRFLPYDALTCLFTAPRALYTIG